MLNVGQKNQAEKLKKESTKRLAERLLRRTLIMANVFIDSGETRRADECIRVYVRASDILNKKDEQ